MEDECYLLVGWLADCIADMLQLFGSGWVGGPQDPVHSVLDRNVDLCALDLELDNLARKVGSLVGEAQIVVLRDSQMGDSLCIESARIQRHAVE
jgi:hypothetical protein